MRRVVRMRESAFEEVEAVELEDSRVDGGVFGLATSLGREDLGAFALVDSSLRGSRDEKK